MASESERRVPSDGASGGNAFLVAVSVWYGLLVAASVAVMFSGAPEGSLTVAVVLALVPIGVLGAFRSEGGGLRRLEGRIDALSAVMQRTAQEQGLSEGAKRVIRRREERELLRSAIEQDIQVEDWDAAMVLVKELAERFGYRADAEEFRTRIERARAQTLDRRVVEALATLDEHIRAGRWAESFAEAARIERLYPDSHRVSGLRDRVEEARQRHRRDLERRFLLAAEREKVDEAMALLRELDQYLTPAEAEPFAEVARGVITKSRENLGVRFKLMVQDHQWAQAIEVGEQIVGEFPNTRMAQEVRELVPVLRERVAGLATGSVRG